MASSPTILDSDFKYIDKKGNLLRTRTELTVAQMLSFLEEEYQYNHKLTLKNGNEITIDFKTKKGLIEVIDNEEDIEKYKQIKEDFPQDKIMAIGHPKYTAQIKELQDLVYYDKTPQTGSIFLEDGSFSFDYAHILPLVEKCSILHGHTSSVMVELVGQMKNNLLLDFGIAKKIIKEVVSVFDHKFFINRKYLKKEDDSHYLIQFEGPKGMFELQVPKNTTYLLEGEATVENLSTEIIQLLAPKMPSNIEAIGVYIYEGYNKGSHIISNISR
ncbi:6-carboxytetrahydropterin synthase [Marine Group I thaumarchaeote]|uniref:6-carboxytetrahydropterin synthase n=1 Tax=Marine Group I thaumarchaeote TaxID=2511932 RepID=A0A7K4MGD9_9ARCH|nr:6-pyruvoyl tetrahydropterin synthase [Candidatus Nitrosopumilus sp. MTA1]NWJ20422.1 6-carboxytetrahydropterin synthase [Marine Group I thaumarchaeote]NWJ28287.1 6-carboxytetrahydropterin synthase [Marine Group I thaumarchaeote]NWJ56230.1 6-carboxytetrahydropterin synthase [Marine Group I thaumarchaeote]NWK00926.1 6-carboxytetrahydropterin synthase [Marine Group I thaumarchaeote]